MTKTPNLGLPLRTAGHVVTQRSLKEGFTIIDTKFAELEERVEFLETQLNDSNSAAIDFPG